MKTLENNLNIKFNKFQGRDIKNGNKKYLDNLNLETKTTLIFDDNPILWVKDYSNVIISKKFIDKEIMYLFLKDKIKNNNYF